MMRPPPAKRPGCDLVRKASNPNPDPNPNPNPDPDPSPNPDPNPNSDPDPNPSPSPNPNPDQALGYPLLHIMSKVPLDLIRVGVRVRARFLSS